MLSDPFWQLAAITLPIIWWIKRYLLLIHRVRLLALLFWTGFAYYRLPAGKPFPTIPTFPILIYDGSHLGKLVFDHKLQFGPQSVPKTSREASYYGKLHFLYRQID